ncbi:MAG: hypothetical protein J0L84_02045 [Verrucomicrobia bacterium]|nr:hypothetical protein [Verrucomicrobiota bacterium]
MKAFFQRAVVTLCSGYIIVYFGEFVFWATPDREGMTPGGLIAVWLMYSVMAYPFLWVVNQFRVRDPWAVWMAGAFYGWFEEGLVVQTTYGSPDTPFPMSISFTALAWHAPIDIWIGWYAMRRVLAQNRLVTTLAWASGIGVFYGLWGIFWWNEPPPPMKALLDAGRKDLVALHFALFAFGTTVPLLLAYGLLQRMAPIQFRPSTVERWGFVGLALLYFAFVTVPAAPRALWVLPPLMGLTFWALNCNRRIETRPDVLAAIPGPVKHWNYPVLLAIPLMASVVYGVALAWDVRAATNLAFYYVATPVGALLWIAGVVVCVGRGRPGRRPLPCASDE